MAEFEYTVALKPIGETIKPYDLVAIKKQGDEILVRSLKTKDDYHISKKDKFTHLCEESLYDFWFKDSATKTIRIEVEKYGFLNRKTREVLKSKSTYFADSPITEKVMSLVACPAHILMMNYRDVYMQFYKTFDHIIAMCEALCKNYKYLDSEEIEKKINDATEIVKSHFRFAVEVVEQSTIDSIKNTYKDVLEEQSVILDAYKNTVDRLNEINPNQTKSNSLTIEK